MTKRHHNNLQLALDILRGRWLLSDAEVLLPQALKFLSREPLDAKLEYTPLMYSEDGSWGDAEAESTDIEKKVIVIPIHGPVTKYWSCDTVGTLDIANDLLEFASKDEVVGIVLDIDCPGGASNAVPPMVEAIRKVKAMGKPIVVHGDMVASAAYWFASECDAIFLDNSLSIAGSIGAYASYVDEREDKQTGRRTISVYAPESTDKNKAYREALEGRYELCQEELSELVQEFHKAVKENRPKLKTEEAGVLSGALFAAAKAIPAGLADGMKTLSECIENVFIRAEYQ